MAEACSTPAGNLRFRISDLKFSESEIGNRPSTATVRSIWELSNQDPSTIDNYGKLDPGTPYSRFQIQDQLTIMNQSIRAADPKSGGPRHLIVNQQSTIDNYWVRAASSSESSAATPAAGAGAGIVASVGASSSGRGGAASLKSLKLR